MSQKKLFSRGRYVILGLLVCQTIAGLLWLNVSHESSLPSAESSMRMDIKEKKLIQLIDQALAIAEHRAGTPGASDPLSGQHLKIISEDLKAIKEDIKQGRLEPSQGGNVMITPLRAIIDWGEPENSDLRLALYEIEIFYAKEF